jgi:hypothetical protein
MSTLAHVKALKAANEFDKLTFHKGLTGSNATP